MAHCSLEPCQELAQIALVGLECLVRLAPLMREMREPGRSCIAQVLGQRKTAVFKYCRKTGAAHVPIRLNGATIPPRVGLTGS